MIYGRAGGGDRGFRGLMGFIRAVRKSLQAIASIAVAAGVTAIVFEPQAARADGEGRQDLTEDL